jgi:hypothetical protein
MTTKDFELELQAIDPRLSIVSNSNRPQLCNIKLSGIDICPIPSGDIKEERDPSYVIELGGRIIPHRTRQEAIDLVKHTLDIIATKDGAEVFFGN